ncbi:MAG: RNA polymerase sigma factor [Rhodothermales bacterium]
MPPSDPIPDLVEHRRRLVRYVRSLTNDPDLTEDVVQEALLKTLRAAPDITDEDALTGWLFRVAKNTVIDLHRSRQREAERLNRLAWEVEGADIQPPPEDEDVLCACYEALLPTLKPEYAELISAVELGDEAPEAAADRLGITRNNLKVRRHRARQQLRQRLEESCRACAEHGCLDCTCTTLS